MADTGDIKNKLNMSRSGILRNLNNLQARNLVKRNREENEYSWDSNIQNGDTFTTSQNIYILVAGGDELVFQALTESQLKKQRRKGFPAVKGMSKEDESQHYELWIRKGEKVKARLDGRHIELIYPPNVWITSEHFDFWDIVGKKLGS